MRWVVYGAGAVGGVVAARLVASGEDVTCIARGAHAEAIRTSGLRAESPDGAVTVAVPVRDRPDADVADADVIVLAMKSHDTRVALDDLASAGVVSGDGVAIVCLQNGVANERAALRRFARVYGVCVMLPTGHLEPGVVEAYSSPVTGILDVGRYPTGVDEMAEAIAEAFSRATFVSEPRPDIMRWKYAKLLMNLGNAAEALCGPGVRGGELVRRLREEGVACLQAAGIAFASEEEDRARRGDLLQVRPIAGRRRGGGSSWQSLARKTGSIETDYLNGEVVLLGRLHGVSTPANALLQRLANEAARAGRDPGSMTETDALAMLEDAARSTRP